MIIKPNNTYRPLIRTANAIPQKRRDEVSISFTSNKKVQPPNASLFGRLQKLIFGGILCITTGCSTGAESTESTVANKLLNIWNSAGIKANNLPDSISYTTTVGTKEYALKKVRMEASGFNLNDIRYDVTPTNTATEVPSRDYIDDYSDVPDTNKLIQGSNLQDVEIEANDGCIYSTDPATGEVKEILEKDKEQKGLFRVLAPNGDLKTELKEFRFDGNLVENTEFKTKSAGKIIEGVVSDAIRIIKIIA